MDKDTGTIHRYLCKRIMEKRNNPSNPNELVIGRNDFRRMLGWFNIPYYIQCQVIDEMKRIGLIKIKDKQNIILVRQNKKDNDWFY